MPCRIERAAAAECVPSPAGEIGLLAARALLLELACRPKPGLVDFSSRGSNPDMDAALFLQSIVALRPFLASFACAGLRGEPFETLRRIGADAEAAMLERTGGVNTHRGAIFSLGLLAAAAGRVAAGGGRGAPAAVADALHEAWGEGIAAHEPPPESHGSEVRRRYGVPGACGEAARGFPALFRSGLPALEDALDRGCGFNRAMVQAFFAILAMLEDTNLYHRGGRAGIDFARGCARGFLDGGGVFAPGWGLRVGDLHRRFMERGLSPGGAGDMLAAAVFLRLFSGRR